MLLFSQNWTIVIPYWIGTPKCILQKLQRVQNTAARLLINTKLSAHITPVLINLHWLPVQYRIQFKILLLVYKALHDLSPSYLKDLLAYNSSQRKLRSTSHELLRIPRSRLKSYGDAFASQDQSYGTSYHWILGKALRWLFLRNLLKHIFLKCFLIVFNVSFFYI